MSTHYTCGDGETLVAYLYDELDAVTKTSVTGHLATCATCRDEAAALGGVRHHLAAWTPPAPPLRFSIVSESEHAPPSNVVRPAVPAWYAVPRWAQAVAATVALAVGLGAANVQVRHDATGWTFSTGWRTPAAPAVAAAPAIDAETRQTIAALQQQVSDLQAKQTAAAAVPAAALASPDAISVARVNAMLEASERRQQQELAMRLTQVIQDFDMQRRADLMRVDQRVSQLAGQTRQAVTEQGELLKGIVRAGLRPPQ